MWQEAYWIVKSRPVHSMTIIVVAAIGILVNGATAMLFIAAGYHHSAALGFSQGRINN